MQNRRGFMLTMITGFVALAMVVGSVIADELLGVIAKVNVDDKKVTILEDDTDKKIDVKVNDETEWVTRKGTSKLDSEGLEKLEKIVKKYEDQGKKISVKVTHEKKVASKIEKHKKKSN